jgi:hypothetical protein
MALEDIQLPDTSILPGTSSLGEKVKRINTVRPDLYQTFTIDLSTAHAIGDLAVYEGIGDTLAVETLDGTASIVFNSRDKETLSLNRNRRFAIPFSRFWIINTAQPGKTLRLNIGRDGSFEAVPLTSTKLADINANDINPQESATTPVIYPIDMPAADTEYAQLLPANTKAFMLRMRSGLAARIAYETGKVATPTDPYYTLPANAVYSETCLKLNLTTLYIACSTAGQTAELLVWS